MGKSCLCEAGHPKIKGKTKTIIQTGKTNFFIAFRKVMVNLPSPATRMRSNRSGTCFRNGITSTSEVVHRLIKLGTMPTIPADLYANAPSSEATQLYKSSVIFYPVSRSLCRKSCRRLAILKLCCRNSISTRPAHTGRNNPSY